MASSAHTRILSLRGELEKHNRDYYLGHPSITDLEFDRLMKELTELEAAHPEFDSADSPTKRVGGSPIDGFVTVEHAVPMMSIDNTYDEGEVRAFDERVRKNLEGEKPGYVLEPKIDGVAASLRYEKGLLVLAATRGDGRRGDDITAQVRTIRSVPLRLDAKDVPGVLEVRGEIYMPTDVFVKLNKQREEAGDEIFKNPRNLTTGTLKQLDPKITAQRKLSFVCHGLGEVEPLEFDSYWKWLGQLRKWGLPVAEHSTHASEIEKVIATIESFAKVRGTLAYQTDGMVVKVESFAQRDQLGVTSKAPRWVIAYKYAAEQAETILLSVDWQVGKGGTLTPVARMVPVFVAGTTVQNASLHNIDQIRKLDVHLGDTLVIEKAGEVIPYIRQVVVERRPKGAKAVAPPRNCPSCHTRVEKEEGTPFIRCVNPDCPAQLRERLKWFVGRNQMDIENIGESLIDQLINAGLVKKFGDLFRLKMEDIANLESVSTARGKELVRRVGEKTATKIVESVEGAKERGLGRVLSGLAIPHVGVTVGQALADWAGSSEKLLAASEQELREALSQSDQVKERDDKLKALAGELREGLKKLPDAKRQVLENAEDAEGLEAALGEMSSELGVSRGISAARAARLASEFETGENLLEASAEEIAAAFQSGGKIARSAHDYFQSELGKSTFVDLEKVGVRLTEKKAKSIGQIELTGKTVVITGTFSNVGRTELTNRLKQFGVKVTGSVSASTGVLLAGEKPGDSKVAGAKKHGIETWDEGELEKRVPELFGK